MEFGSEWMRPALELTVGIESWDEKVSIAKGDRHVQEHHQIALKGIAMAMGVAVIVMRTLKTLDVNADISMLGFGLPTLALANFQE